MNILVVNLGTLSENIVSSSILRGLRKMHVVQEITWCVSQDDYKYIFQHNKFVSKVISLSELICLEESFDLLINLNPFLPHHICDKIKIGEAIGFGFNEDIQSFESVMNGDEQNKNMNLFQMYYKLAGMTWRGEGYCVGYYPKTRSKKNRIGIAVAHANVRNYLLEELDLKAKRIWYIPNKKNMFKKMDEINKCNKVVTDDMMTFHLAMSLKKYVYFLKTMPLPTKIELFGNGEIYEVPYKIFK